ncbi:MAG: hypothetical protein MJB57_09870 [Gemmatimonadetes bacterium]|nr:hypothetical protein [Gemmatimonadota bacterium]
MSAPTPVAVGVGLFILVALAAAAVVFRGTLADWTALDPASTDVAWRARPAWIGLAGLAGLAALLTTAMLWADLFRSSGGRLSRQEAIAAWLGSNLGRYVPGKIWQLTGIAAYARARGDSAAAALVTAIALQAVMLATGAGLGLALCGRAALEYAKPTALVIGGLTLGVVLSPPVLRWLIRLGERAMGAADVGAGARLTGAALVRAGVIAIFVWGFYGLGFWALSVGLMSPAPVSWPQALGVFAAGYVVGYAALFAPGGLVIREGAIAGLLAFLVGLPLGAAGALAVGARLWTTTVEVVAFFVVWLVRLRRRPEPR